MMDETRAYYLAGKLIDGDIEPAERAELDQWIGEDPTRQTMVEELRQILTATSASLNQVAVDTDAEWEALQRRLPTTMLESTPAGRPAVPQVGTGGESTRVIPMRRKAWIGYAAAAAIVVLLLAGGYALLWNPAGSEGARTVYMAESGHPKEINLPDGSNVMLGGGSRLVAEAGFGQGSRRLTLEGEAYFKVAHNPAQPFEVTSGTTKTTVLGTEFNLRAYDAKGPVYLSVVKGRVSFETPAGIQAILEANESLRFDPSDGKIHKVQTSADAAAAWRNGTLDFDDEPLAQAVLRLNHFYDIDIRLGDGLKDARLTARFEGSDEAAMLDVLATTYQVKLRRQDKTVWLEK